MLLHIYIYFCKLLLSHRHHWFQGEIHELLALVYYDGIQNVVPFYDQRFSVPSKDATWKIYCQNSMSHFKRAFKHKYLSFPHLVFLNNFLCNVRVIRDPTNIQFLFSGENGLMLFILENSLRNLGTPMTYHSHITLRRLL